MFTNRMILSLLLPVLVEQIMMVAIKIADTAMVAHVGESAVAGISFVVTFDNLIKSLLSALAIGCSVVVSQYIGKEDIDDARKAMKMSFYSIMLIFLFVTAALFLFQDAFLGLLTGPVEPEVFGSAKTYFALTLFSYPFYAACNVASASFRAMQNSRIPMAGTLVMMGINLALKAVLIYVFDMGVFGAGLSTLISVMFIGIVMTFLLCRKSNLIYIDNFFNVRFDFSMIRRILKIGIPNSIENGMFQFGILMLQRLSASFGTAAIAANAIVKSITPISFIVTSSFGLVIITVVGQCMGAGKTGQADFYIKHILKINYIVASVINVACIVFSRALVGGFSLSDEATGLAVSIFLIYCTGAIFTYPSSFMLPNALRGAGDTKFTMVASITTMFGARIGLAYVFGLYMGMGLSGVWLAMQVDWIVRSVIFVARFVRGKWKTIKVV